MYIKHSLLYIVDPRDDKRILIELFKKSFQFKLLESLEMPQDFKMPARDFSRFFVEYIRQLLNFISVFRVLEFSQQHHFYVFLHYDTFSLFALFSSSFFMWVAMG